MWIRILQAEDAAEYFDLRLRALREHPEAFATSFEEARRLSPDEIARKVAPGPEQVTLGVFHEQRLVGLVSVIRPTRAKLRHRATIAAMYVAPEARGAGLGRALLGQAVEVARAWDGVTELALSVTVGNRAARELYAAHGFVSYGIEPRSLCVEGRYHDVEWMNLCLDPASA